MTTMRALMGASFALALALAGCGSITAMPDSGTTGAAGSGAGGTTGAGGAGGSGAGGTTGAGGSAGASAGRGGSAGGGKGGAAGSVAGRGGNSGSAGAGGVGGSAGRGGAGGGGMGSAGRGGTGGGGMGTAGRGGSPGTGGGGGPGNGGRGGGAGNGMAGSGAGGRGGTGGGPCICQTIYDPVCGVDGKTYSNSCEANCAGVAIAYQGACVKECTTNAECIHYADGIGDCCGACLPKAAPMPPPLQCIRACDIPITCPCVAGKCTATPVGALTQ